MKKLRLFLVLAVFSLSAGSIHAAETVSNSAKKAVRKVKDDTCHLVDGKMQCAAKKVKHKVQNASDSVKAKANH